MKKCLVFLAVILLILGSNTEAAPSPNALPNGGNVVAGNATITRSANHLQINQQSQKAIINWQSFNIGSGASTHFQQPAQGIALNRINPNQGASQIFGHLSATGRIILVNQAGIYFGPNAYVNVGGIIASTSDISNANFLSGHYVFDQPSTRNGAIVNEGTIIAKENGLVALIGDGVSNEGLIQAHVGNVILASGDKFTVSLSGDQLINFTIDEGSSSAAIDANGNKLKNGVNNSGTILADAGTVLMTAKVASNIIDQAVNMTGVIEARSIAEKDGVIILDANDGTAVVAGQMNASGESDNGGTIKVLGQDVHITQSAGIYADGKTGGGTILMGGNQQGNGPESNAKETTVDAGAILSANAIDSGNGGNIIVWSDDHTEFHGNLSATGGLHSGNGGFAETSGHYLDVSGAAINLSAPYGTKGTWLLDPTSIYIANNQTNATTAGMTGVDTTANTNSGTSPTSYDASGSTADSLLTTATLIAALANSNVVVTTNNANGAGTGDITVVDPITWSSANSLTLSAYRNIVLDAAITNGANSSASVTLQTDNTGTGTGTVTSIAGGLVSMLGGGSQVKIYYNPTTFGTQDTLYSGGTPSPTQYMLINSLGSFGDTNTRSLASLSNPANSATLWNQNFALSTNIDASNTSLASWNTGSGFAPIGNNTTVFSGEFDGQGHTINNLYINFTGTNQNIGFIGNTSALVANLGLTNASVTVNGNGDNTGIIVGQTNSGIANVYATGSISLNGSDGRVAGIVGVIDGLLTNSYSSAAVAANITGGFFNVGGLVGLIAPTNGTVSQSYSTGSITVVSASDNIDVGGIAGGDQSFFSSGIFNSYNTGSITVSGAGSSANGGVGGIAGVTNGSGVVDNTYSTGLMNVTGGIATGGILGFDASVSLNSAQNSAWDTVTTGQSQGVGGGSTGTNLVGGCFGPLCAPNDLSQSSTYQALGWNIGAPGSNATWQIVDGVIYPHLINEGLHTFTGTVYSDNGITPVSSGVTVNLSLNGAAPITTVTDNSGSYSYLFSTNSGNPVPNGNIPIGTDILIYPSSASTGNLIFQDNGQTINSAQLLNNQIIAGVSGGNAASNTILATALGSLVAPNIGYSLSGNNIIIGNGESFTSSHYIFDGNLNTTNGDINLNAPDITLAAPTITLSTNIGNITVNGDINGTGKALVLQGLAANADTFTLNNSSNALQSLTVSGGASHTAILSIQDNLATQNWIVDGAYGGNITGVTGIPSITFSNIDNLIGGNSLTASNTANTWTLTGSNTGSLLTPGATYAFSGFTTLVGGGNNDDFVNNSGFTGTINGGSGNSTIDMGTNPTTTTWFITGANQGTGGGLTGFSNIQNINAATNSSNNIFTIQSGGSIVSLNGGTFSNNNTLIGPNTSSTWILNGAGSGNITSPIATSFANFANITGGTGANNFTINAGANIDTLNGGGSALNSNTFNVAGGNVNTLNGGAGPDNFLITSPTNPVTFDFNSNNSGTISGGASIGHFTQIPNITSTTSGDTINISSSVNNISVGDNTTIVVTGSGNVGTLNGGNTGTYTISGTIGLLNGGAGTNLYILNNGASITSLVGGGSGTNNTLNFSTTTSANTWNVNGVNGSVSGGATISNYTAISNLIGSNNGDTFNISGALNNITGGSGNDTFAVSSSAFINNINGGAGNNTLHLIDGSSTWNITGSNSGNLSGLVSAFNNIGTLSGSSDGIATFKFSGPYAIAIDGGNISNINVLDVSSVPQAVNITVGPKSGSVLNSGTLTLSDNTIFASFTRIQSAIGNGGILTTNPTSLLSSLVLTSATQGQISDPFFFTGFTPALFITGVESNVSNVITGSTDSNSLLEQAANQDDILNIVDENLLQLINNEIQTDTNLTQSNTYCFQ